MRLVGAEYAEALAACEDFAAATGALASHAYDHPLIAAGAGTLLEEIRQQIPGLDTVVVAVGGGGLFAGIATAAQHHGVRVVAVEPQSCRALNAALEAGRLVDVTVDSIAADSLGARRTCAMALHAAQQEGVHCVLVPDTEIVRARQTLWDHRRVAVEHGAATALAALTGPASHVPDRPATYRTGTCPRGPPARAAATGPAAAKRSRWCCAAPTPTPARSWTTPATADHQPRRRQPGEDRPATPFRFLTSSSGRSGRSTAAPR